MDTPLVEGQFLLEKFPGKGGWTYAALPVKNKPHTWFGWMKVRGRVDDFELKNCTLMPMGNGNLFLAVKAEIRKKIKKEAGDTVTVTLYSEEPPSAVEDDFFLCLEDEPAALEAFEKLKKKDQDACRAWIFATTNDNIKVERMAQVINQLAAGLVWDA